MALQQSVNRLAIQIDSLQEGFELLSRASSVKELGRKFFHVLRGNLGTSDIHICFKQKPQSDWQLIHGKDPDVASLLPQQFDEFELKLLKGKSPKIVAAQLLVNQCFVGIILGRKLNRSAYSPFDKVSIRIFLQLFANAYQSYLYRQKEKQLVFSLNHRLLQLNSLIDAGISLTGLTDERMSFAFALQQAASITNASWGSVRISWGREVVDRLLFPEGMKLRRVKQKSHQMASSFKFHQYQYLFELFEKESREGTVPFEETDQRLLDAVARQVCAVMETRSLHKVEMEKQKIERDISLAASIQQRLLPTTLPAIEGYESFGMNVPTRFVGGDYYDCIPLADGRFAFVVADVAGKGVPAALLVSSFHAYLTAFFESDISLAELGQKLNTAIYKVSPEERYVTALLALLEPKSGNVELLNAGHNPAYILRHDGTIEEVTNGGLAIGMMDIGLPYESSTITLAPGEQLLLYSDGVTEAMNEQQQQYDNICPLKTFMRRNAHENAETFVRDLISDVREFVGSAPQSDDITALALFRF